MTEIILAYVDGLPIPSSSNFFTKLASEYLGGGCVKCCSSKSESILIGPTDISGKLTSSSFFWSLNTFKNPSNLMTDPLALHTVFLSSEVIVIVFLENLADCICDETALLQIKS